MSGCCAEGANGVASGGGGAPAGFAAVVDIDWREVQASTGDQDLNSSGAILTDLAGAQWTTPSMANGDSYNQNNGSTSWGLTANGLEVVGCATAGLPMTGATAASPHVYINLRALAAAHGFDGDPLRPYIFQCFVSAQNGLANDQLSGCGINKMTNLPAELGATWSFCTMAFGFSNGSANNTRFGYQVNGGVSNQRNRLGPGSLNVPTVQYSGSGAKMGGWAGVFGSDWPANADLRMVSSQGAFVEQGVVGDPYEGFRFTLFHTKTAGANAYDAVIQRTRILQGGGIL